MHISVNWLYSWIHLSIKGFSKLFEYNTCTAKSKSIIQSRYEWFYAFQSIISWDWLVMLTMIPLFYFLWWDFPPYFNYISHAVANIASKYLKQSTLEPCRTLYNLCYFCTQPFAFYGPKTKLRDKLHLCDWHANIMDERLSRCYRLI